MIYKVALNKVSRFVFGTISLLIIIFSIYQFELNPTFFKGLIFFVIILNIIIPITEISLNENELIIEKKRCFSLIRNMKRYELMQIKDIYYHPLEINTLIIIAIIILPGTSILNGNDLKIILKDNTILKESVGLKKNEIKELVKLTKQKITVANTR